MAFNFIIKYRAIPNRGGRIWKYLDIIGLWTNVDVPRYQFVMAISVVILNGAVSKRGGNIREYLDLLRLRCDVDSTNRTRK